MTPRGRPRRFRLRDDRMVTLRAIVDADAPEIVQAFQRLSDDSRYNRFMQHKKQLDGAVVQRGVRPQPGRDFALVATIPAADGIDIVGAAQYVRASHDPGPACEFAITVAEDWRGVGLATALLSSLLARARDDGYETIEGWVLAQNTAMLALARRLAFTVEPVAGDATLVRVQRTLKPRPGRRPAAEAAALVTAIATPAAGDRAGEARRQAGGPSSH